MYMRKIYIFPAWPGRGSNDPEPKRRLGKDVNASNGIMEGEFSFIFLETYTLVFIYCCSLQL